MQVARMCVACLRLGHTQQVIQGAVVLAKQKEWEVLLMGLDCIADIGAEDEAAVIRDALAGESQETLLNWLKTVNCSSMHPAGVVEPV